MFALGAGAACIGFGEFVAGGSIWVTLGGPLLVMASYIAIGWNLGRSGESISQFADSVYYLGFLFTLTALVAALIGLGNEEEGVWRVVNLFGVKLVTTLVGLGFRVYLTNFQPSVEDSMERTEELLARAGTNLRHRFDQMAVDLKTHTDAINVTLTGAVEELNRGLAEAVPRSTKALRETLDHMGLMTAEAITTLRTTLDGSVKEMNDATISGTRSVRTTLTSAATRIGAASDALGGRLDAFSIPPDLLTARLQNPLERLASEIEAHATRLSDIGEAEDACAASARGMSETIAGTQTRLQGLGEKSVSLEGQLGVLTGAIHGVIGASSAFEALAIAVRAHAATIRSSTTATAEAEALLRESLRTARERLTELEADSRRTIDLLAELEERLRATAVPALSASAIGAP